MKDKERRVIKLRIFDMYKIKFAYINIKAKITSFSLNFVFLCHKLTPD